MNLTYLNAADLQPHTLLGREGMLPDMIEREIKLGNKAGSNREDHKARAQELIQEFEAAKRDILANGIMEPLKVVNGSAGWLIADGRNRWAVFHELTALRYEDAEMQAAATALKEQGIPCIEITEAEVPRVILSAMTRRHMSKQARALMAVKAFPAVAEEAKRGRRDQIDNDCLFVAQEDLAGQVGVSGTTMKDACHFWRAIALNPKTREERMNQVFAGMSFERVLQGETGASKTKGKPREADYTSMLLIRNANSLKLQFSRWGDITVPDQTRVIEGMVEAMAKAPVELREAILTAWETSSH